MMLHRNLSRAEKNSNFQMTSVLEVVFPCALDPKASFKDKLRAPLPTPSPCKWRRMLPSSPLQPKNGFLVLGAPRKKHSQISEALLVDFLTKKGVPNKTDMLHAAKVPAPNEDLPPSTSRNGVRKEGFLPERWS